MTQPAVHLSHGGVRIGQTASILEVATKASKRCDGLLELGATGAALCPVASILNYLVHSSMQFKDGHALGSRPPGFWDASGNDSSWDRPQTLFMAQLQDRGCNNSGNA